MAKREGKERKVTLDFEERREIPKKVLSKRALQKICSSPSSTKF